MSGFLPNIVRQAGGSAHGGYTPERPAAADSNIRFTAPTQEKLRRTIQTICGSGADNDGYLKLLRGVRRRFGEPSASDQTEHLPLIVTPRNRPTKKVPGARFSQGVHVSPPTTMDIEAEEATERNYVLDSEVWARRVAHEMMIVHYVSFVMCQEIEEVQHLEREQRASLRYTEEKERHWLLNESDVSTDLVRMRNALRAREEKERRLAEQEKLYPTVPADDDQAIRPGAPAEYDARAVLRRYMRLKHMADADIAPKDGETRANKEGYMPATPVVAVQHVALRKTLGIAAYMTLLEKHDETRRFIMACEESEFGGIKELFQEDLAVVWAWEHKRMHLERLIWWRNERDERSAQKRSVTHIHLRPQSPPQPVGVPTGPRRFLLQGGEDPHEKERHMAQIADLVEFEGEGREIIVKLEVAYFRVLDDAYSELLMQYAAMQLEDSTLVERDLGGKEENEAAPAAPAVFIGDSKSRAIPAAPDVEETLRWTQNARKHMPRIVALQRAVVRWRAGRLGWRYTHREIGRALRAHRDEAKIERGQKEIATFRASLMAECDAVKNEILAIHAKQRESLIASEMRDRDLLDGREMYARSALQRKLYADFLHNVTEPAIRDCIWIEEDDRRETDVTEEFVRSAMYLASHKLLGILKEKQDALRAEVFARDIVVRDEGEDRRNMHDVELDERELLRIALQEFALCMADARGAALAEALAQQSELQQEHEANVAALQWRCREGHLEMIACDTAPRAALLNEFFAGRVELMDAVAEDTFRAVGEAELAVHAAAVESVCEAALTEMEAFESAEAAKAKAEKEAKAARDAKRSEDARLTKLQAENAAASRIQVFYRASLAREIGLTATRRYLRSRYAHKVEVRKLCEALAVQRTVVRQAEEELRNAERELCEERAVLVGRQISILIDRTEPRERRELESLENIIFNIMERNRSGRGEDRGEPDRIAVLWQFESYERVGIVREWRRAFETAFEPKKNTFVKDIMAAKIQRVWRCAMRERRLQFAVRQALERLVEDEEEQRNTFELNQLHEFACNLVKPTMAGIMLCEYLSTDIPMLLEQMCLNVSFAFGIEEEEWRNRMLLLWRMRHHYLEAALDPEEEAERARVEQQFYYDGVAQLEMIDEEETIRRALEMERNYFLLRILVKAERESRNILECDFDELQVVMYEHQGRCNVIAAWLTTLCESLFVPAAYDGAIAIDAEEDSKRRNLISVWEASKPQEPLETLYATEEAECIPLQQLVTEEIKGAEEVGEAKEIGEVKDLANIENVEVLEENGSGVVPKDDTGESLDKNQSPLIGEAEEVELTKMPENIEKLKGVEEVREAKEI